MLAVFDYAGEGSAQKITVPAATRSTDLGRSWSALKPIVFAGGERLPARPRHIELIRGDDSDLKNSGGREGHAILGAIFLKQFVDAGTPWAHLDIAGVADVDKDQPYCPKGGTGFGVRLLADYLERVCG